MPWSAFSRCPTEKLFFFSLDQKRAKPLPRFFLCPLPPTGREFPSTILDSFRRELPNWSSETGIVGHVAGGWRALLAGRLLFRKSQLVERSSFVQLISSSVAVRRC
jgi:hypothetical protein